MNPVPAICLLEFIQVAVPTFIQSVSIVRVTKAALGPRFRPGRSIPPLHGPAVPSLQMGIPCAAGIGPPLPLLGPGSRTNGGQSFTAAATTSTNGDTAFALALNPATNDLWMGTEQYGIFRSTDDGATWNVASPPDTTIDSVHGIDDGNIFAITFYRSGNVLFGIAGRNLEIRQEWKQLYLEQCERQFQYG